MTNGVYLVGSTITDGTLHSLDYQAAFFLILQRMVGNKGEGSCDLQFLIFLSSECCDDLIKCFVS
jgi:hypothetical protein